MLSSKTLLAQRYYVDLERLNPSPSKWHYRTSEAENFYGFDQFRFDVRESFFAKRNAIAATKGAKVEELKKSTS